MKKLTELFASLTPAGRMVLATVIVAALLILTLTVGLDWRVIVALLGA